MGAAHSEREPLSVRIVEANNLGSPLFEDGHQVA